MEKILIIGFNHTGKSQIVKDLLDKVEKERFPFFTPENIQTSFLSENIKIKIRPPVDFPEFNSDVLDLPPKKDFNHPNSKSINESMNFISDSKRAKLRKKRKKRK